MLGFPKWVNFTVYVNMSQSFPNPVVKNPHKFQLDLPKFPYNLNIQQNHIIDSHCIFSH